MHDRETSPATSQRIRRSTVHVDHRIGGRYTIEQRIGEGGFSVIYRGTQISTGRRVAIKVPRANRRHDPETLARFRREAEMLCALRDPHTITAYDYGHTEDGTPFIVLELLEGITLRELLRQEGALPWERVCRIMRELCCALAEAHDRGIVHRDLKPENVFLECRPLGEGVKLLDFGIAKSMRAGAGEELTSTGETVGTADYMSPEQRMAAPLDGRSDLFALGVLAHELLTGRTPHAPDRGVSLFMPPLLAAIIRRCLEIDRQRRFADAAEVAAALDLFAVSATGFATHPDAATVVILDPGPPTVPDLQLPRASLSARHLALAGGRG